MTNRWGNSGNSGWLQFLGSKITADGDCSHEIKRHLLLGGKVMTNLDIIWKSRDIILSTKVHLVLWFFLWSCMDVSWTVKKAERWRIDAFELWCWRRLESPLAYKEIKTVNPKGNKTWILTGRTDPGAEAPMPWPPDVKSWHIRKDPDARKDWRQEKGTTEDEMVGWHHWLSGHEFEQALGVGDGQGSLACCSPWSLRVGHDCDWTELKITSLGFWKD